MGGSTEEDEELGWIKISPPRSLWPSQGGSLCERFLALRQEGSVREFCQTFETTTSMLQGVAEAEGVFINRLGPEIRAEVRLVMARKLT